MLERFLGVLCVLMLMAMPCVAQDSVSPNATRNQINSTIGTAPDKIITTAKFIGFGNITDSHMESVDSVLRRQMARITALEGRPVGSGGTPTTVTQEWSADDTSWHATKQSTDRFTRIIVDGTPLESIPFDEDEVVDVSITDEFSVDGVVWVERAYETTDKWHRFKIGDGAFGEAVPLSGTINVTEIVGFDERVERILELNALSAASGPLWSSVPRQVLRVGEAFSLDLSRYVDEAISFSASGLAAGITLSQRGMLSWTPTTEGGLPITVTATDDGGSSDITFILQVLRRVSFDTGRLQRLEGLTISADGELVALGRTGHLYYYLASPAGESPVGQAVTGTGHPLTLTTGAITVSGDYTALTWTGSEWLTLGDAGTGAYPLFKFLEFNTAGTLLSGYPLSDTRLRGARGLVQSVTSSSHVWTASLLGVGRPYLEQYDATRSSTGQSSHALNTSIVPQGLAMGGEGNRFWVLDAAGTKVWVYNTAGTRGSAEQWLEIDLLSENSEPRGIAYHQDYLYVVERGQGAVNDAVYIYPTRTLWDASAPFIEDIAFTNAGPYKTGTAVRVAVTFSSAVNVAADARLRLEVGDIERKAVPVASPTSSTTAALNDVTVANFLYTIVDADVDIDGIKTYPYPFSQTDGSVTAVNVPTGLPKPALNGNSYLRLTQPGGLRTLNPQRTHRSNAPEQNTWENLADKPSAFPIEPADQASLSNFEWARINDTSVEFLGSVLNPASTQARQVEGANGWNHTFIVPHTDFLYMRIEHDKLQSLVDAFILNDVSTAFIYEPPLIHAAVDTGAWVQLTPAGRPFNGHYYYGLRQELSAADPVTVSSFRRQMRYSRLAAAPTIPKAPVQSDWTETDTTSLAYIENKPADSLSVSGEDTYIDDLAVGEADVVHIPIPTNIRNFATSDSTQVSIRTRTLWRSRPRNPIAYARFYAIDQVGHDFPGGPSKYQSANFRVGSTYHVDEFDFSVPATTTAVQFRIERRDSGGGTVEISKVSYTVSLPGEGISDGDVVTSKLADGAVTTPKVADAAITEPKLKIGNSPDENKVLVYSGSDMWWTTRFNFLNFEMDSAIQVANATGAPTLAIAQGLVYAAQVSSTNTDRTGRVLYVRIASAKDIDDYVLHIGNISDYANHATNYVIPFNTLVHLGDAGGNGYYHSKGLTLPANKPVYIMSWDPYERKLITLIAGEAGSGGGGTITDVTASSPLVSTGTTTKNISVDSNAITPALLKADTDAEKQAMRERFEAAWNSGADVPFVVGETSQGAGGAGANLDWNIALTNDLQNFADGRPYELTTAVTLAGVSTTETIVVTVSLRSNTDLSVVYDTEDVTSASGGEQKIYLSASLAAGATGLVLRTVRKTGTIGYKRSAEGVIQVQPKPASSGGASELSWTPTRLASSTPGVTATFSNAVAVKVGRIVHFAFAGTVSYAATSTWRYLDVTYPTTSKPSVVTLGGFNGTEILKKVTLQTGGRDINIGFFGGVANNTPFTIYGFYLTAD